MEHTPGNEAITAAGCLSLQELCEELSISTATARNWIKLGKLSPQYTQKNTYYFTKVYIQTLKEEIKSGKNKALKSRRNKKYISGNALYKAYVSAQCENISVPENLLELITEQNVELSTEVIQYLVADCALQLFAEKLQLPFRGQKKLLLKYLNKEISLNHYAGLIDALIMDTEAAVQFCQEHPFLFCLDYAYEVGEDILGLLYISCKNLKNRKATGSYYTPTKVVRKLIAQLSFQETGKILDPCCGTGNFLLQLPDAVPFSRIFGNDTDTVSVKITRLNMALKFSDVSVDDICQHITESDYLTEYKEKDFQFIIGNPPWGYDFTKEEKELLKGRFQCASVKNVESYDVFMECALSKLAVGGQLAFVLPEAVLNVKAHTPIRHIILKTGSIRYLEFLGNTFDGVQCPCIILQIAHTGKPLSTIGMQVKHGTQAFQIALERKVSPKYFSFLANDEEYKILEKIKNTDNITYLAGQADFALGIVTGNNKAYLSNRKTAENERILKGADICKYHIKPSENYIVFKPERFQQTAPTKLYRAPEKLLYRFISSQLVFAYDNKQTLSLNSCNMVIPRLVGLQVKYVLAILNSRAAQFIYKKEFNSVKVLRAHIERIPIPVIDAKQQDAIIAITDRLIQGLPQKEAIQVYDQLDTMIMNLFQLTPAEQEIMKTAVDGENKFLT